MYFHFFARGVQFLSDEGIFIYMTVALEFEICICFAVKSARLDQLVGLFSIKPDPYVELIVDGQPPRKTMVAKKTICPKWEEDFTV